MRKGRSKRKGGTSPTGQSHAQGTGPPSNGNGVAGNGSLNGHGNGDARRNKPQQPPGSPDEKAALTDKNYRLAKELVS